MESVFLIFWFQSLALPVARAHAWYWSEVKQERKKERGFFFFRLTPKSRIRIGVGIRAREEFVKSLLLLSLLLLPLSWERKIEWNPRKPALASEDFLLFFPFSSSTREENVVISVVAKRWCETRLTYIQTLFIGRTSYVGYLKRESWIHLIKSGFEAQMRFSAAARVMWCSTIVLRYSNYRVLPKSKWNINDSCVFLVFVKEDEIWRDHFSQKLKGDKRLCN